MKPQEIFEKNQVLTVAKAKELLGITIAATSSEYRMNTPHVSIFVVGKMISEWDYAEKREYPNEKYDNFQQYWKSYMTKEQIDAMQSKLILFSSKGETMFRAYTKNGSFETPTFFGSDSDREVYYVEIPA